MKYKLLQTCGSFSFDKIKERCHRSCIDNVGMQEEMMIEAYWQAFTNCPGVRRHGYAANFVAITMSFWTCFLPET